jgi:hypothetical protein
MPSRALTPNYVNAATPTVLVDVNYAMNALDVNIFVLDVQASGITVTLPQNPQVGVTFIQVYSEFPFFISGGAFSKLSPADPLPVGAGAAFACAFTSTGWNLRGQLTNIVNHNAGLYGTGADGNVVFNGGAVVGASFGGGQYTLTRDTNYNNATVNAGQIVNTAGFRFNCGGLLTNNGTIQNNGVTATTSAGAAAVAANSLGGSTAGGAGGAAAVGAAGGNMAATAKPQGSGAGGAGGAGGGNAGGAGGTLQTASTTSFAEPFALEHGVLLQASSTTITTLQGGTGGGGGGGSGTGGGGGSGGGICGVFAFYLVNNGIIQANGGNGAAGQVGNGGGGGGGGAGAVAILTRTLGVGGAVSGTGTINVNGGAGGAGLGTGSAGVAGASGGTTVLAA